MFDFGFSEVLLTSVIALIVLGPEKLPRAASQVGRWVGRARAMARQFREQLEEEVNLENVKKAHKEEEAKKAADARQDGGAEGAAGVNPTAAASPSSTPGPDMNPMRAAAEGHDPATQNAASDPPVSAAALSNAETPFSSQISPDPADFRADTFSHAHPTDDFGANPLTANGAPEPTPPAAASEVASEPAPPLAAREVAHEVSAQPAGTAATTAAAPSPRPQDLSTSAPHRPESGEAYASATATVPTQVPPPASDTATDAHSTTSPEKSGPA